jgi:hypothetical protein
MVNLIRQAFLALAPLSPRHDQFQQGLRVKPITLSPFLSAWYTHSEPANPEAPKDGNRLHTKSRMEELLTACWTRESLRKAEENAETDVAIKKRVEARSLTWLQE